MPYKKNKGGRRPTTHYEPIMGESDWTLPFLEAAAGYKAGGGGIKGLAAGAGTMARSQYSLGNSGRFDNYSFKAKMLQKFDEDAFKRAKANSRKRQIGPAKEANKSVETQEVTNTKGTSVNYNIAGYDLATALQAGKRLKSIAIDLGPAKFIDNTPDFYKLMNKKAVVSTDFAFRMTSTANLRVHHYQTFRHKWSEDYSIEDMQPNRPDSPYPANTVVLGPAHSPHGYTPPGISASATIDVIPDRDGITYPSIISLNDLYDQSYRLSNQGGWGNNTYVSNLTTGQPHASPVTGIVRPNDHTRMSYIEYWNSGNNGADSLYNQHELNRPNQVPPQFFPCINKGTIEYSFSNKGVNSARVEIIVYRIKKTANLPWKSVEYEAPGSPQNKLGLIAQKHELALGAAYLKMEKARIGVDDLGGETRSESDIIGNPKVKLLPVTSALVNSDDPLVEISREAFIMGAGDKRNTMIKLPGIHTNPFTENKEKRRDESGSTVPYTDWEQTPFDHHCYFVCLATNGLLATKVVADNYANRDSAKATGNIFAPSEVFCEAKYTEYCQAANLKQTEFGNNAYNHGKIKKDQITSASTVIYPATIFPLADMVPTSVDQVNVQIPT